MDMIGTCVWECYEIVVWKENFVVLNLIFCIKGEGI
jgi:hypothetical protein